RMFVSGGAFRYTSGVTIFFGTIRRKKLLYQVMYTVHIVAALALLFYIMLPFLAGGARNKATAVSLHRANRIGQYVLVLAFLSGGYMVGKADYPVWWMVVSIVLVLVMFAMTGMSG